MAVLSKVDSEGSRTRGGLQRPCWDMQTVDRLPGCCNSASDDEDVIYKMIVFLDFPLPYLFFNHYNSRKSDS